MRQGHDNGFTVYEVKMETCDRRLRHMRSTMITFRDVAMCLMCCCLGRRSV